MANFESVSWFMEMATQFNKLLGKHIQGVIEMQEDDKLRGEVETMVSSVQSAKVSYFTVRFSEFHVRTDILRL